MKLLLSILLLVTFRISALTFSPEEALLNQLQLCLKQGQAGQLASLFDNNVDLLIDNEQVDFNDISNSQAEIILKSFFKRWPAQDFQVVYQGDQNGARYCTGLYKTPRGNYAVYVLMKRGGEGKFMIESLQFRKDK